MRDAMGQRQKEGKPGPVEMLPGGISAMQDHLLRDIDVQGGIAPDRGST